MADSPLQREALGFHVLEKEGTGNRRGATKALRKLRAQSTVPEG